MNNTYSWNAQDYQQHSQAQQKWARELLGLLKLNGNERILDLGCGDGKVTVELAQLVKTGSVVGVDNSSAMIELAQQKYPATLYPNLDFQVMDARALNFESQFDVVFSNAVLHWVSDHKLVLNGLFHCLKPGGKILLRMGGQGDAAGMIAAMDEVKSNPQWAEYFTDFEFPYTFMGVEDYQALLMESGFAINRVQLLPKDMTHKGVAGLSGWIRTTWLPYTNRVATEQRQAFIDQVCAGYLRTMPLDNDDQAHVAMVMIEVEAQKPA